MGLEQGNIGLLQDPVAQQLLSSNSLARLAYTWSDGSPRVVPIWFHWNGRELVLGGPPDAPKVDQLRKDPRVALTIDASEFPYKVLLVRGRVEIDDVEGVGPEYAAAAERYFGPEGGKGWVDTIRPITPRMARLRVQPEWVGIIDFEQRFPSAIARAMAGASAG